MNKVFKIYHVETQEDYDDLMIKLENEGYAWVNNRVPTSEYHWEICYENTFVVTYEDDKTIGFGHVDDIELIFPNETAIKYKADKKHKAKGVEQMEKVVVPQFVADWYEEFSNNSLGFKISELSHVSKRMEQWINSLETDYRCGMEIVQEVIAKMHLYGYEVEEEKKYYWRKKKGYLLEFETVEFTYLNYGHITERLFFSDLTQNENHKTKFTETEVRELVSEEDFNKLEKVEVADDEC